MWHYKYEVKDLFRRGFKKLLTSRLQVSTQSRSVYSYPYEYN